MGAIWLLDRHITIGITSRLLDQHGRDLDRQITLHEGGEILPKNWRFISDLSPIFCHQRRLFQKIVDISPWANISSIYRWYFGDFCRNISSLIFLYVISYRPLPVSRRYIADIFRHFPFWLKYKLGNKLFINNLNMI